jgi:hypothetical protein
MRKIIFSVIFCVVLLLTVSGCRNYLLKNSEEKEEYDGIKTYVRFKNEGNFSIDVFVDPSRLSKLCSLHPRESMSIEVIPDPSVNIYYLTYHVSFDDVYIPYSSQYISFFVEPQEVTDCHISRLNDIAGLDTTQLLTNKAYIRVDNKSSYSLQLLRGSTPVLLDGATSSIINQRNKGLYVIDESLISSYLFKSNMVQSAPFPAELTALGAAFLKGHYYSLEFDVSGLKLVKHAEMTIANALTN